MPKFVEYMVCHDESTQAAEHAIGALETLVDAALEKGWKCQGGVRITAVPRDDGFVYWHAAQAMTRELSAKPAAARAKR